MSDAGKAVLVLENGQVFDGQEYGITGEATGEVVFNTGLTGYQETLTDPSYFRQIVVFTTPHIGNTGMNDEDVESAKIWVSGLVVRDPARIPSNWRSTRSLAHDLAESEIVGISGLDTRQLTRVLRDSGVMRGGIFSGASLAPVEELLERVRSSPQMEGAHLVDDVSTKEAYEVNPEPGVEVRAHVVAVDLGAKAMSPTLMARRGMRVTVVPSTATIEDVLAAKPNGVFFSNGPGDPGVAVHQVELARQVLAKRIPFFGICYGHQILGRALGFGTYKLRFGHRGDNQPVKDLKTGKVEITTHNHGFAVEAPVEGVVEAPREGFGRVRVSHINLNDNVVEGLECLDIPAFGVQYHPEGAAGPHDANHMFDRYLSLILGVK